MTNAEYRLECLYMAHDNQVTPTTLENIKTTVHKRGFPTDIEITSFEGLKLCPEIIRITFC